MYFIYIYTWHLPLTPKQVKEELKSKKQEPNFPVNLFFTSSLLLFSKRVKQEKCQFREGQQEQYLPVTFFFLFLIPLTSSNSKR